MEEVIERRTIEANDYDWISRPTVLAAINFERQPALSRMSQGTPPKLVRNHTASFDLRLFVPLVVSRSKNCRPRLVPLGHWLPPASRWRTEP